MHGHCELFPGAADTPGVQSSGVARAKVAFLFKLSMRVNWHSIDSGSFPAQGSLQAAVVRPDGHTVLGVNGHVSFDSAGCRGERPSHGNLGPSGCGVRSVGGDSGARTGEIGR